MTKEEYLRLMEFPKEWLSLGMLPDDLVDELIAGYSPGDEISSEHERNGVFHWWLKKSPGGEVLTKLARLSFLDPDQIMAADVRRYISSSPHANEDLRQMVALGLPSSRPGCD